MEMTTGCVPPGCGWKAHHLSFPAILHTWIIFIPSNKLTIVANVYPLFYIRRNKKKLARLNHLLHYKEERRN
jgi:hypothetical protein